MDRNLAYKFIVLVIKIPKNINMIQMYTSEAEFDFNHHSINNIKQTTENKISATYIVAHSSKILL